MIRTSVNADVFTSEETVKAYKDLSHVEQAFRSFKSVDLKILPIYHRTTDRVKAHIFLCMLAYYVEWHMRQLLNSILFDEDDEVGAALKRKSIVTISFKSDKALAKAQTKRTEDNLPVHSFQTLLADLATIVKNQIQSTLAGTNFTFDKITEPTRVQQKALDLLGISLICTQ